MVHHGRAFGAIGLVLALGVSACGQVRNDRPSSDAAPADGAPSDGVPGDGPPIDGPPAIDCMGKPFPTTAPPVLSFTGRVIDGSNGTPLAGATIMLWNGSPIFSVSADAQGQYSAQTATGGKAQDALLAFIAQGYVREYRYPSHPFDLDQLSKTEALSDNARMELLYSASGLTWDGTAAFVLVRLVDCTGAAIQHARIQVSPPGGKIQYFRPSFDPDATDTDDSGIVEILNQPGGVMTITPTAPPPFSQLRAYSIMVDANTVSILDMQP